MKILSFFLIYFSSENHVRSAASAYPRLDPVNSLIDFEGFWSDFLVFSSRSVVLMLKKA